MNKTPPKKKTERQRRGMVPAEAYKIGFWTMLRDVFCRAIDRGQLIPVVLCLWVSIYLWRVNPSDLTLIQIKIIDRLCSGYLYGWFLFAITLLSSYLFFAYIRRKTADENHRIGREKTELQEQMTQHDLGTSRKPWKP